MLCLHSIGCRLEDEFTPNPVTHARLGRCRCRCGGSTHNHSSFFDSWHLQQYELFVYVSNLEFNRSKILFGELVRLSSKLGAGVEGGSLGILPQLQYWYAGSAIVFFGRLAEQEAIQTEDFLLQSRKQDLFGNSATTQHYSVVGGVVVLVNFAPVVSAKK
jgi:hypothetical protein